MLILAIEKIKIRDQNCRIESQPITSHDKHTYYQDLKRINRFDKQYSYWPLINTRSNVIKVGRDQIDLIPMHHHCHHLINDSRNLILDEQGSIKIKFTKGLDLAFMSTGRSPIWRERRRTEAQWHGGGSGRCLSKLLVFWMDAINKFNPLQFGCSTVPCSCTKKQTHINRLVRVVVQTKV